MLLLRYIFGLPRGTSSENIPQIQISFTELPCSLIKDAIIVSLDTEAPLVHKGEIDLVRIFQVGVSIFDTRFLLSNEKEPENAFQTFNFCSGGQEYCAKAARRFLFGKSKSILPGQLRTNLQDLFSQDRSIVLLVFQGIKIFVF
jgi:hypothetical protein